MIKPGRPTRRCMTEDLTDGWASAGDRQMAHGEFSDISKELHELRHQVIKKAATEFTRENSTDRTLKREGITDLSEPMWWKLKVGRWRGAVLQDEDGQAWICAAGLRRGKESTDFYQSFMAAVKANGPKNFLPTSEDRERLRDEIAEEKFLQWERALQEVGRDCVFQARGSGVQSFAISDPDGELLADMTVAVSEEVVDDVSIVDAYIEIICRNYADYELLEWAETVILLALDAREQVWRPTSVTNGRAYSLMMDPEEAAAFFEGMEGPLPEPGVATPGAEAHWTHRHRLTESTIMGDAVQGLCGRWFVPRQDHDEKPPCKHCETIYSQI